MAKEVVRASLKLEAQAAPLKSRALESNFNMRNSETLILESLLGEQPIEDVKSILGEIETVKEKAGAK